MGGCAVVALGGLADLGVHTGRLALVPWLGADGQGAHLLTLGGMLLACVGLVVQGLRRS
jgi:hypothetical protein